MAHFNAHRYSAIKVNIFENLGAGPVCPLEDNWVWYADKHKCRCSAAPKAKIGIVAS